MQDTSIGRLLLRFASKPKATTHPDPRGSEVNYEPTAPTNGTSPPADNTQDCTYAAFEWDDPEATPDPPCPSPPDGDDHTPTPAATRKMSILQRARLILFNRQQRKHRHAVITAARQSAIRHSAAFQPFTLAPAPPSNGIGAGHEAFNLGPITFCRRCGATKSLFPKATLFDVPVVDGLLWARALR